MGVFIMVPETGSKKLRPMVWGIWDVCHTHMCHTRARDHLFSKIPADVALTCAGLARGEGGGGIG